MRLLFISYWSASEPLTASTILPYLRMLLADPKVTRVILVTVERGVPSVPAGMEELPNLIHYPIVTRFRSIDSLSKLDLFTSRVGELARVVKEHGVDMIDSKGSLAGGIAHLVSRRTGVPFVVESFEPHSDYMVDCGVWSPQGVSFRVAQWLERKQKENARWIVTVTENYRNEMITEGVPAERIKIIPSITDTRAFAFDPDARKRIRSELGWEDALVGVYVGKFGGLYYELEAFVLFEQVRRTIGHRFRLILITVVPEQQVRSWLANVGFPQEDVVVRFVEHSEVPNWLAASDFAFSLHRITRSSRYFSPVKNGEYWANGLPTLLPHGVSDDFQIVQDRPWLGAIFDPSDPKLLEEAMPHLIALVGTPGHRERIMRLAREIRDIGVARTIYEEIFGLAPKSS